jgi:hypothetical protein
MLVNLFYLTVFMTLSASDKKINTGSGGDTTHLPAAVLAQETGLCNASAAVPIQIYHSTHLHAQDQLHDIALQRCSSMKMLTMDRSVRCPATTSRRPRMATFAIH